MTTLPAKPKTKRVCLKCRQPFSSEGSHNRICGGCKEDIKRLQIDTGLRTKENPLTQIGR